MLTYQKLPQSTQSIQQAMEHIQSLPVHARQEVFDFIDFMRAKNVSHQINHAPTKKRQAGTLKGEVIFKDDFDEPLDDFKDYM